MAGLVREMSIGNIDRHCHRAIIQAWHKLE
jgi:hypothetical protein